MKRLLNIRKSKKKQFNRQEYFKHKRLKKKWLRPRGRHSKLAQHEKARGLTPSPGYGSPRKVRGLSRQGLPVVRISNPSQLEKEMKACSVIISSTVGKRKRQQIVEKARELKIKISNI